MHIDEKDDYRRLLYNDPPEFVDVVKNIWVQIPDLPDYNQKAFRRITRDLDRIRRDSESDTSDGIPSLPGSRGVLVLGEAGTGKTHLLMRVAQTLADTNHVFFVRRPNNEAAVAQHIWSEIIESLGRTLPTKGQPRSQLDDLLAHVFSSVLIREFKRDIEEEKDVKQRQSWMSQLQADPFNLFSMLGTGDRRKKNQSIVRNKTLQYLQSHHPDVDPAIADALIKYCFYVNPDNKRLIQVWLSGQTIDKSKADGLGLSPKWIDVDEDSRASVRQAEEQALKAIRSIGVLATYYQPLILAFDQLEGLRDEEEITRRWGDVVREIFNMAPNYLIITCIFPSLWDSWFSCTLDKSTTERIAQQSVQLDQFQPNHGQSLLTKHLEASVAKHELPTTIYPFEADDIEDVCAEATSPRMFLQKARDKFEDWLDEIAEIPDMQTRAPVTQEEIDECIRVKYDAYRRDELLAFETDIPKEQYFFGCVKDITRLVLGESSAEFTYGEAEYGHFAMPQNITITPKGSENPICIAVINSGGNAFASRMRNLAKVHREGAQFDSVVVLRDSRSPAIGAGGNEHVNSLESQGGVVVWADKDELATLYAMYNTQKAVEQRDLSVRDHVIDKTELVRFFHQSRILVGSKYFRSLASSQPMASATAIPSEVEGNVEPSSEQLLDEIAHTKPDESRRDDAGSEFARPELSRFAVEYTLPSGRDVDLSDAANAVKQEYEKSVKWKRLRCLKVSPIHTHDEAPIYRLDVGKSIEFDWTWEGATAFRADDDFGEPDWEPSDAWSGEVVEVDQTNGHIFIWVSNEQTEPTPGLFVVRPFEFLASLHSLYCDPSNEGLRESFPARLNACLGEVHPVLSESDSPSLSELLNLWRHSWGVIWGPPGTGKTYTVGKQAAECFADSRERILIVSTTNKATDEVALSCGKSIRARNATAEMAGRISRIGKGANYEVYKDQDLLDLLEGTESELLPKVALLKASLARATASDDKAQLRQQLQATYRQMKDASLNSFRSEDVRVVIATSFRAMTFLTNDKIRDAICEGYAPFTTVFIDEAGLVSRATIAALSMLASRRVVLVGDSKQLAPICKTNDVSRILLNNVSTWLASSGLSHLQEFEQSNPAVFALRQQYRMHPHICAVVSAYQYDNKLLNAEEVTKRNRSVSKLIKDIPRSIWYVLDEDDDNLLAMHAVRGPGNRSWMRPKTRSVLKKLFADEEMRAARGLFVSPFVAQTSDIQSFFAEEKLDSWTAATVHSQQGTEAEVVIFDTVHAGSHGWQEEDWKRLVNVGLSRAKEFVLLLASRSEMREPYLAPLTDDLEPRVLKRSGGEFRFVKVPPKVTYESSPTIQQDPNRLGSQIARRKSLLPVLSYDQQRLCNLKLDGKPRLVRGVAGSGKTLVLANWLVKTILDGRTEGKIWVVYANAALEKLIKDAVSSAWNDANCGEERPPGKVKFIHVKHLLNHFLPQVNLNELRRDEFDYDRAAEDFLTRRLPPDFAPTCDAMFIDEAQDMGPNTLKFLFSLVRQTVVSDPNSKSINVFYDNAQNIFGRSTPKWTELGLDMRGRSYVMTESFRSTRPIMEFALNTLYRLQPPKDADHNELVQRELIELSKVEGQDWWKVNFNQIEGPAPSFHGYSDLNEEYDAIGDQIVAWISEEGVKPNDICIIHNDRRVRWKLESRVKQKLDAINVDLVFQQGEKFNISESAVLATTAQSFKGFDAEIVVIPGADMFFARDAGILANNLYVAMTRARSILSVYGLHTRRVEQSRLLSAIEECAAIAATSGKSMDVSENGTATCLKIRLDCEPKIDLKAHGTELQIEISKEIDSLLSDQFDVDVDNINVEVRLEKGSLWVNILIPASTVISVLMAYPSLRRGARLLWRDLGAIRKRIEGLIVRVVGAYTKAAVRDYIELVGEIGDLLEQYAREEISVQQFIAAAREIRQRVSSIDEAERLQRVLDKYCELIEQRGEN